MNNFSLQNFQQLIIFIYGFVFLHTGFFFQLTKQKDPILQKSIWFLLDFGLLCISGAISLYLNLESRPIDYLVFLALLGLVPLSSYVIIHVLRDEAKNGMEIRVFWMGSLILGLLGILMVTTNLPVRFFYALAYAWIMGSLTYNLIKEGKRHKSSHLAKYPALLMFFLIVAMTDVLVTFMLLLQLSGQVEWMFPFWFLQIISLIGFIVLLVRSPESFQTLGDEAETVRKENSPWFGKEGEIFAAELIRILKTELRFLAPDLKLYDLSKKLGISRSETSELISRRFDCNFRTLVNRYRVEHACFLIVANPEMNLLEIGFNSGFNSKSVFYDAFKKIKGVTPARYRTSPEQIEDT